MTLSGRDIEVTATASGAPSPPANLGRTDLALWLFNPQAGTNIVDAGPLRPGTALYRASLAFVCPGSCQLTGVGLLPALPALPELPAGAAVIPLQFALPAGLVAAVALAVVAVVLLSAGAVGLTVMRRMSPLLLRTAPDDTAA